MRKWALQVYDSRDEYGWIRKTYFPAVDFEAAVEHAKDVLLWPFGAVQETLAGDEAQFVWHEKNLQADLWLLDDEEE